MTLYLKIMPNKDVVAYSDPECKNQVAIYPGHYSNSPRKGCKTVMLNCVRRQAVWV